MSDTPIYASVMQDLRVRDPLGGRTPADTQLATAMRKYARAKQALADVSKKK